MDKINVIMEEIKKVIISNLHIVTINENNAKRKYLWGDTDAVVCKYFFYVC